MLLVLYWEKSSVTVVWVCIGKNSTQQWSNTMSAPVVHQEHLLGWSLSSIFLSSDTRPGCGSLALESGTVVMILKYISLWPNSGAGNRKDSGTKKMWVCGWHSRGAAKWKCNGKNAVDHNCQWWNCWSVFPLKFSRVSTTAGAPTSAIISPGRIQLELQYHLLPLFPCAFPPPLLPPPSLPCPPPLSLYPPPSAPDQFGVARRWLSKCKVML